MASKLAYLESDVSFNSTKIYLSLFMVDDSERWQMQLNTWLDDYNEQVKIILPGIID